MLIESNRANPNGSDEPVTLRISDFARVFADTATSYKLFWFRGVLQCLKARWALANERKSVAVIPGREVVREMIVAAWPPVCLFRLSLGQRDKLAVACRSIQSRFSVRANATPTAVRSVITDDIYQDFELDRLLEFVPALF